MTRVYCFTGYPASGKSTASSIASNESVPVVEMGSVVRRQAREMLADDETSEKIGVWATEHREKHGNSIFAEYTADAVEQNNSERVVIDGLRTPRELSVFRNRFDEVTVVLVETPFKTRLERIRARDRDDEGSYTADDLKSRDEREAEWGIADLINEEHYDTVIENTSTIDTFEAEVRRTIGITG